MFWKCVCSFWQNIFVNILEKIWLFTFLIMLSKQIHMGWRFQRTLKSSIFFILKHNFMCLTWHIMNESVNCHKTERGICILKPDALTSEDLKQKLNKIKVQRLLLQINFPNYSATTILHKILWKFFTFCHSLHSP